MLPAWFCAPCLPCFDQPQHRPVISAGTRLRRKKHLCQSSMTLLESQHIQDCYTLVPNNNGQKLQCSHEIEPRGQRSKLLPQHSKILLCTCFQVPPGHGLLLDSSKLLESHFYNFQNGRKCDWLKHTAFATKSNEHRCASAATPPLRLAGMLSTRSLRKLFNQVPSSR